MLFIMLNPSTADAEKDDPTIRRCMAFAKRELCTELTVINLYALRATNPKELVGSIDPEGPENFKYWTYEIERHLMTGTIVAAWGANRYAPAPMYDTLKKLSPIYCLGKTKGGAPRHPLYVRADQPLEVFL